MKALHCEPFGDSNVWQPADALPRLSYSTTVVTLLQSYCRQSERVAPYWPVRLRGNTTTSDRFCGGCGERGRHRLRSWHGHGETGAPTAGSSSSSAARQAGHTIVSHAAPATIRSDVRPLLLALSCRQPRRRRAAVVVLLPVASTRRQRQQPELTACTVYFAPLPSGVTARPFTCSQHLGRPSAFVKTWREELASPALLVPR